MVVIVIVLVVAKIGAAAYQKYVVRARFSEVINAVNPYKKAIEECAMNTGDLNVCVSGINNIPAILYPTTGWVYRVGAGLGSGVVRSTAVSTGGLQGAAYAIRPTYSTTGGVTWKIDTALSTCISAGLC
jgi:type II secretory pathway pseudopilin PulG